MEKLKNKPDRLGKLLAWVRGEAKAYKNKQVNSTGVPVGSRQDDAHHIFTDRRSSEPISAE